MPIEIKKQFEESFSGRIYHNVKKIPLVRLFFDFNYAGKLWNNSFLGKSVQKILTVIGIYQGGNMIKISQKQLPHLLCLCVAALLWREILVIPAALFSAAVFIPFSQSKNFAFVFVSQLALSFVFAAAVPFAFFLYIIYVETGIILFFMIKYSGKKSCIRFIYLVSVLWMISASMPEILKNTAALTVAFMPYCITALKRGKIRKYLYSAVILSLGFYALSHGERAAFIGGCTGIAAMILSGEFWLIVPAALSAPAVISFTADIFNENIIKTGFFLWKYGFGGGIPDYGAARAASGELKIIFDISSATAFVFFWYVLRLSRSAFIKLFKRKTKNNRFLRSGLGSIVGFSVYTFFAYNGNLPINIILYLISAALLERTCGMQ